MVFGILDGVLIDLMTDGVALAPEGDQADTRFVKKQVLRQLVWLMLSLMLKRPVTARLSKICVREVPCQEARA